MIASIIANSNRDPKRRPRPYEISEFMGAYGEHAAGRGGERKPMTAEDWQRAKRMAVSIWGGRARADN